MHARSIQRSHCNKQQDQERAGGVVGKPHISPSHLIVSIKACMCVDERVIVVLNRHGSGTTLHVKKRRLLGGDGVVMGRDER